MKSVFAALILTGSLACAAQAAETPAEEIKLKDGSTLFVNPDGKDMHMVDAHGRPMTMKDGEEMEAADGRILIMTNNRIWVDYGPKGDRTQKIE